MTEFSLPPAWPQVGTGGHAAAQREESRFAGPQSICSFLITLSQVIPDHCDDVE